MEKKRVCRHCRHLFIPVRNPQQRYCSDRLCQNARKSSWCREKLKHDSDYRENQNQACKRWRKKSPQYWKHYRAAHSFCVEENRYKQRQRKQFYKGPEPPYPRNASQFANSGALTVKIFVIPNGYQQMGEVCKHTTL